MNWLDIVLLGTLAVCAAVGLRLGLIKAVLVAAAVYVGGFVAGRVSGSVGGFLSGLVSMEGDIGDLLNRTVQNETILTVATYAVIIGVFLLVARLLSKMAFVLKLATMGLSSVVDRGGGLLLGLLIGVALTSAAVLGLAALAYGTAYDDAVAGAGFEQVEGAVETLEGTLVGSQLVSVHLEVFDLLPGNALGYVPPGFKQAVSSLQSEIDRTPQQ